MTEKEIRRLLRIICADLDRRGRRVVRRVMLPSVLGAGMALTGCGDRTLNPADGGVKDGQGQEEEQGIPQPAYMAPDDMRPVQPLDLGPIQPPYMAPDYRMDYGPVQPPYMAPDFQMDYGAVVEYMAPDSGLDFGPVPPYMAPDMSEFQPLYAAPAADLGPDPGPQPEYMAPEPEPDAKP